MLAVGNGDMITCINNLMSMRRGECAYSRIKGIDQDILDDDVDSAELDLLEDAEFLMEQYEPRVSLDGVELQPEISQEGTYRVGVNLVAPENDSNDVEE